MTLNQLLKQNQSFYGASVIAGEYDLDREVKSVMVLEAADIENWGKPGQLLLTSFYALQILDAENSRKFFITMQQYSLNERSTSSSFELIAEKLKRRTM